jgi:hypothetical protein
MGISNPVPDSDRTEDFQVLPDRTQYRPVANVTLEQGIEMVTDAIRRARAFKKPKMLLDLSGLTGFASPSIAKRFFFIQKWAEAANGEMCIGFVARPEMIDPQKFGVTVARNSGLICDIFPSEAEALDWLEKA